MSNTDEAFHPWPELTRKEVPDGWPADQPASVRGLKPTPYTALLTPECFPDEAPEEELDAHEVANRVDGQVRKACAGRVFSGGVAEVRAGLGKAPQLRSDEERAAVSAFLGETTRDVILEGLHARLYTPRTLVQALHVHQLRLTDYRLVRALNRYALAQWWPQVWKTQNNW